MTTTPAVPQRPTPYLSFSLGGEDYALPALRIREIIEYEPITPLPGAPPSVRGVINLRGSVVPVVDLAVAFGLPSTVAAASTCVVVAELEVAGEVCPLGLLADAVHRVLELSPADIEPPPSFGLGTRLEYLSGMGKIDGQKKFLMILDLDKILVLQDAARTGAPRPPAASDGAPRIDSGAS